MYDELIKRLRHDAKAIFGYINEDLLKAADAIEGLSHAVDQMTEWRKNRWIPVTERLPEESGSYLIADSGTIMEAYYGKEWAGDNWTDPVEMYMTYHPTHWMPLPAPPEDK